MCLFRYRHGNRDILEARLLRALAVRKHGRETCLGANQLRRVGGKDGDLQRLGRAQLLRLQFQPVETGKSAHLEPRKGLFFLIFQGEIGFLALLTKDDRNDRICLQFSASKSAQIKR